MDNASIIGLDILKRGFQVHGARADGATVLRRKLTRAKVLEFLASQPRCPVVMETCGGARHWGREIQQLGHEVRLIAPLQPAPLAQADVPPPRVRRSPHCAHAQSSPQAGYELLLSRMSLESNQIQVSHTIQL